MFFLRYEMKEKNLNFIHIGISGPFAFVSSISVSGSAEVLYSGSVDERDIWQKIKSTREN